MVRVEVSTDDGSTWQPAQLGSEKARYAWRLWDFRWQGQIRGLHNLSSAQLTAWAALRRHCPVWNPSGYLNNAVDQVKIHVKP